jgi:hypothetical protein
MKHGHVFPNPRGMKARCGGPAMCETCRTELLADKHGELLNLLVNWAAEPVHTPARIEAWAKVEIYLGANLK